MLVSTYCLLNNLVTEQVLTIIIIENNSHINILFLIDKNKIATYMFVKIGWFITYNS